MWFLYVDSILREVLQKIFIFLRVLITDIFKLHILNFSISLFVGLFILFVCLWDFVHFFHLSWDVFSNWSPDTEYKNFNALDNAIIFPPGRHFE